MYKINRKFASTLSLLLVLSQWLSLAHATDHLIQSEDTHCQVCTLQHNFHSVTVDSTPVITNPGIEYFPCSLEHHFYVTSHNATKPIRAPPQ